MTTRTPTLDRPIEGADPPSPEVLFKEARQRRRRRWIIGISAVLVVASLAAVVGNGAFGHSGHAGVRKSSAPARGGSASQKSNKRAATSLGSKRAATLTGLSCSSADTCTAIGDYYSEAPVEHGSLVLRWTGTTWRRQRAPVIGPATTLATIAVSCPTARQCVAVGASGAMVWDGNRWRAQAGVKGDAVSCPSTGFCVAVGASAQRLNAEIWRDGKWTSEAMPLPTAPTPLQSVTLSGLSCTSERFCIAVGNYSYGATAQPSPSRRELALAEVWNGEGWRLAPPVNPAPLSAFRGVSCRSPEFCVAVGTQRAELTLAERWTGAGWKVQASPNPSTVGYSMLDAVSCPSTHVCESVGSYNGSSLIAESWQGRHWSLHEVPSPGPVDSSPTLSCPAPDACVSAGMADGRPFSQIWNGRAWRAQRTPSPLP